MGVKNGSFDNWTINWTHRPKGPSETGNARTGRKVIKAWKTGSLDRKSGMNKGKDRMERGFRTGMRNDQDGTGKRLVARNLCMTGGETFKKLSYKNLS
jgi:hypothetical protein